MKKSSIMKFIVLTVMCLMSMFNLGTVAHAATPSENEQSAIVSDRIDERRASVRNASSYKITIPTYIEPEDYGTTQYKKSYTVSASNVFLAQDARLQININYDQVLKEKNNIELPYRLYNNNKEVVDGQTIISMMDNNQGDSATFTFNSALVEKPRYAGLYKGTVTFNAKLIEKKAFAVYSADDQSLNFYKREQIPNVGDMFNGKTATKVYTNVENTGNYPSWFSISSNVLKVDVVDSGIQPKNCFRWFYDFRNAKTMNLTKLDTSKTTNMYYMFSDCLSLTSLNISSFNTSNVTNMNYMFSGCSALTSIDINNWDVRNVNSMSGIFVNCSALQSVDLSRWNTSNVTQMNSLFANCNSLKEVNLTGWNTSKVTNMDFMFDTCPSIQSIDLSSFDATNVTDISRMFNGCTDLKTIKTPKNIKNPTLTNVTSKTFYDSSDNYKEYVAGTFPTNITSSHTLVDSLLPKKAFAVYSADDQSLNFYKREQIPNAGEMFNGKTATNVYTNVESTSNNAIPWNGVKNNVRKVEIIDVVSPADMGSWFRDFNNCIEFTNLEKIDTSNVQNMSSMFNGCTSISRLDISKWNTNQVYNMGHMIYNCPNLETINFGNINTSSVLYMDNFLKGAAKLSIVDMSGLDISSAQDISGMFNGCNALREIRTPHRIGNVNHANITSSTFYDESNNYYEYVAGSFPTNINTSHKLVKEEVYNITYNTNGGNMPSSYPTKYLTKKGLSSLPVPTRSGYIFDGWYELSSFYEQVDIASNNKIQVAGSFTSKNYSVNIPADGTIYYSYIYDIWPQESSDGTVTNVYVDGNLVSNGDKISKGYHSIDVYINIPYSSMGHMYGNITFSSYVLCNREIKTPVSSIPAGTKGDKTLYAEWIEDKPVAFTVYSDTDKSLSFYKRTNVPKVGEMFNGKIVTTVNTNIENTPTSGYVSPWEDVKGYVEKVEVVDYGIQPTSMHYWFIRFHNLKTANLTKLDTSKVTTMYSMFYNTPLITSLDLSTWDASNVTNMEYMFDGCTNLKTIKTPKIINNPSILKITSKTFYDESNNYKEYVAGTFPTNISTSHTLKDTAPLKAFAIYSDTDKSLNFYKRMSVPSVGMTFNGKVVTKLYTNVENTTRYNIPWGDVKSLVTNVKVVDNGIQPQNCSFWFDDFINLTSIDLSKLDTSQVTGMSSMFNSCQALTTLDISNFDTSQVTDMMYMFIDCQSLKTLNVSSFNTSQVTKMSGMFLRCSSLTALNLSNFNTSQVTNMHAMFQDCQSLSTLNVSSFNTSRVTDMSGMFMRCGSLTALNLSNFNTSLVTDMLFMFNDCKTLTTLDISNFDTSKVTNMWGMFDDCQSLSTLNVSSFNTSQVTNMSSMFSNCKALTALDLSNFDTSLVTNMQSMFNNCQSLKTLNVSSFNTSQVTNMSYMFLVTSLKVIDCSNFDASNVIDMTAMFNNNNQLTTIKTPKNIKNPTLTNITSKIFYDITDNNKEYTYGTIPTNITTSHTLVDTRP